MLGAFSKRMLSQRRVLRHASVDPRGAVVAVMLLAGATLTKETTASNEEVKESSAEKKKKEKKKTHWHTRQRHEESDKQAVLLKDSLKKYKEDIVAFDSVASRFDTFATAMTKDKDANGVRRKAMTFTDFLHSLVLPRFRLSHPPRSAQYTCPFVGDADGLITYEECHLLYHLLEIPVEHFEVAFHMFDLDGNGTVDKTEFLEVLSSVLNNIKDIRTSASGTGDDAVQGSSFPHTLHRHANRRALLERDAPLPPLSQHAERCSCDSICAPQRAEWCVHVVEASYHFLLHFFGKNGKKKITAREFVAVVQSLKESLLRAEFDMYATKDSVVAGTAPSANAKEGTISVHDFAVTMISCFDPKHLPAMLDRLHLLRATDERVSWTEFREFHSVIQNHLADIKLAFELQRGGDEITEDDFIKAAYIVSGERLPAHVVSMAFRVFDMDGNGSLDHEEVVRVLSARNNQATFRKNAPTWPPAKFWACVTNPSTD
ncbi:hypothetical protein, variant 1 [Aphanomyces invadans]|uniref:EF-hand domain-containing protein n=1 Tax=Aphanomyces invadans TaxID=157072 RepID=A0A024TJV8_9STRA|nr:hypothetical protein, variant 1 [Aphanomyces invadans]ETV94289.1 hypothetical protein, variant 1 [Aphanomyces invadans]|eukprot:XP_008877050.1 hypothetical protein, variant 1 [Aphanomyces invadans]